MNTETREQHLEWCKKRAMEYVDVGDLEQAYASFGSDMSAHPETRNNAALGIGLMMLMQGMLGTPEKMRKFINGFH